MFHNETEAGDKCVNQQAVANQHDVTAFQRLVRFCRTVAAKAVQRE